MAKPSASFLLFQFVYAPFDVVANNGIHSGVDSSALFTIVNKSSLTIRNVSFIGVVKIQNIFNCSLSVGFFIGFEGSSKW